MADWLKPCHSLIISEKNLALIGSRFSYDDYQRFYEDTFVPMEVSKEQLLTEPGDVETPDPEDFGSEETEQNADEEEEDDLFPRQQQPKVKDFDFGEDFW